MAPKGKSKTPDPVKSVKRQYWCILGGEAHYLTLCEHEWKRVADSAATCGNKSTYYLHWKWNQMNDLCAALNQMEDQPWNIALPFAEGDAKKWAKKPQKGKVLSFPKHQIGQGKYGSLLQRGKLAHRCWWYQHT